VIWVKESRPTTWTGPCPVVMLSRMRLAMVAAVLGLTVACGSSGSSGSKAGGSGDGGSGDADVRGDSPASSGDDSAIESDGGDEASSGTGGEPGGDGSAYTETCGPGVGACQDSQLFCEGFAFSSTLTGYACTRQCTSTAECGAGPTGYTVECLPAAQASFCLVVCHPPAGCPFPLSCIEEVGRPAICVNAGSP